MIKSGVSTFNDNINVIDNKKIQLGSDVDLQIYHSVVGGSSTSYIDNNTGPLYIRNNVDDDDGGNIIIEPSRVKHRQFFKMMKVLDFIIMMHRNLNHWNRYIRFQLWSQNSLLGPEEIWIDPHPELVQLLDLLESEVIYTSMEQSLLLM